jgi:hypothetical protein
MVVLVVLGSDSSHGRAFNESKESSVDGRAQSGNVR